MVRIIFLLTLFMWIGIGCDQTPKAPAKKKNLIVITLDTTRADRLSCYGYEGQTTPSLNALAEDSVLFENLMVPIPLTLPSHSTLFTGIYPLGHGVRANVAFQLPDEVQTLAEVLKSSNYETSAFISAMVLNQKAGLAQGFEHYDQKFPRGQPERNAAETFKAVQKWIVSRKSEQPFFLWVHLFDPHYPYEHPEPYKSQFPTSPYNGELAFMDAEIGKFIQLLKKQELYQESIVAVVGDHGESLGDHGELSHGYFTYDCTLRAPFILKLPGNLHAKCRISSQVRMMDIMPTMLHLLDIKAESTIQGTNLAPFLDGKSSFPDLVAYAESYYPFYQYGFRPIEVLRTSTHKLVDTIPVELYDLRVDPNETSDISKTNPEVVKQLKERLQIQKETYSRKIQAEAKMDEKTLAQLGALGYLSSRLVHPDPNQALSPKENVLVHENIMKIYSEISRKNFPKAQDYMTQVLLATPELPMALELQLEIFLKTGQHIKAIEWLQRLLKKYPEEPTFLYRMAQCYDFQNNPTQTVALLKKVLSLAPEYEEVYHTLWTLYCRDKRFEEAGQEIQARLQTHPDSGFCWRWLGKIQEEQKQLESAEKSYSQATQKKDNPGESYYALAKLQAKNKNFLLASQHFKKALLTLSEDDEKYYEVLLILGELSLQEPLQAIGYLQNALALKPEQIETRKKLIELCLNHSHQEDAKQYIQEGFQQELSPKDTFQLILFLEKRGDLQEALQKAESFLQMNPFHTEALLFTGNLSLYFQRKEQALKHFNAFLEVTPRQDPKYIMVEGILKKLQKQ